MRLQSKFSALLFAPTLLAQDPLQVAPAHYKLVFENEQVRVLEGRDLPGERIPMHAHPDTLMVVVAPFKRRLVLANGKTIAVDMKAGDTRWMPAQSHAGENIGDTETWAIFIEFKQPTTVPPGKPEPPRAK